MEAGNEVEWFTASFPGAAPDEVVDGIQIVRFGRQWTVHVHAVRHYRGRLRHRFDLVLDQVNTVPFFTPLWADIPTWMLIWQLARQVWWYESPFPLNALGYALEPVYLRLYRKTPVLTYSESTRADLRRLGFKADINVLPAAIDAIDIPDAPKNQVPTFVYVGRLAPSKRIGDIVRAFALFRQRSETGKLLLIGGGSEPYVRKVQRIAARLGVSTSVELCGWLDGPAKHRRMAEAHALLMASAREGWGLVVTECNACGTPAIVYDVPGLRDSVRHLETGIVVRPNPASLAEGMIRLLADPILYRRLQAAAREWSRSMTYDAGVKAITNAVGEWMAQRGIS